MRIRLFIQLAVLICVLAHPSFAFAAQEGNSLKQRQSQLKAIQNQISQQQQSLVDTSKQRKQLLALLKQDEKAIARVAAKINQTKQQLKQVKSKITELEKKANQLERLKKSQQDSLAKQLASAYLAGNHDYTKMLLSQQNPSKVERMLVYYQYLNNARIAALKQLKQTQAELDTLQQQRTREQTQLNALVIEQESQAKNLNKEKAQRQQTQLQLQRTLRSKNEQLEQLQIEEASLIRVIEQALKEVKANPDMTGLAKLRKKLKWPTKGRIRNSFGSTRRGQIKWKGITLAAPEGQNIHAIAPGKVIFADWLKGFGMVLVIDHGKGYMSLYGYAQALLKASGDTVQKNEPIALVGLSGGQTQPGLYFEIRHKGQAVDPAKYCRR